MVNTGNPYSVGVVSELKGTVGCALMKKEKHIINFPEWFDREKYKFLESFSLVDWALNLSIRKTIIDVIEETTPEYTKKILMMILKLSKISVFLNVNTPINFMKK